MLTKYAEVAGGEREVEVLDTFAVPVNVGPKRLARLRRKAHRHHFAYNPRPGYIYVRSRAISSRCNDNYDEFPAEEIKKAYATFVGKPVFVNHHNSDHRRARGVIIDAALHEDTNPDGTEDVWAEVLMEVDAVRFPVLARECMKGNIARTSMGTDVAYSICTACGNRAVTPADYCQHIPRMKGMKIRRATASGTGTEEVLIAERCYGLGFFENSLLVEDPADPTAFGWMDSVGEGVEEALGISATAARAVIDEAEGIVRQAAEQPALGRTASLADPLADLQREARSFTDTQSVKSLSEIKAGDKVWWRHDAIGAGHFTDGDIKSYDGTKARLRNKRTGFERDITDDDLTKGKFTIQHRTSLKTGQMDYGPIREDYMQRCYEMSARRVTSGPAEHPMLSGYPGSTLVHGTIQGFGEPPLDHAWVIEPGGQSMWEPATDTVYPKADFERLFSPKVEKTYSVEEARRAATTSHHWGPWDLGSKAASMHVHSYGEVKAPSKVDTMRAESCPVCGDDEAFNGDKCSVCGFMQPPSKFGDPDLDKAKETDLRQDALGDAPDPNAVGNGLEDPAPEQPLQCTNCGEVFDAQGDAAPDATDPEADADQGDDQDPDADSTSAVDDLDDDADDDETFPGDDSDDDDLSDLDDDDLADLDDDSDEDDDDDDAVVEVEDPTKFDPAVGEARITAEPADDATDVAVEPNQTCPICGEGTLIPQAGQDSDGPEPKIKEVGTDPTKVKEKVAMTEQNPAQKRRSQMVAAIREQQTTIERQAAQIKDLTTGLATLAVAAGVGAHPRFASIVRSAGLTVKADADTNEGDSIGAAPATSTEEAKKPDATDDVESIGAAPAAANTGVTPEGVTDVNNSDVVSNPPVLDNLQSVTTPVSGTDAVSPAASDQGANRVTVGTPDMSVPDTGNGWKSSAAQHVQAERERFTASVRLARLRVSAGIDQGEDLALGQAIADSSSSTAEINAQVEALASVAQRQQGQEPPRHLVPRAAARQGVAPTRQQPSMQAIAAATTEGRPGEDEWLVGGSEDSLG